LQNEQINYTTVSQSIFKSQRMTHSNTWGHLFATGRH